MNKIHNNSLNERVTASPESIKRSLLLVRAHTGKGSGIRCVRVSMMFVRIDLCSCTNENIMLCITVNVH
jgi:hypothetical protein